MNKNTMLKTMILLSLIVAGCDEDERVAEVATEAADRQAAQNQEIVRLNREVAEGTRRLVEADAEARRDIVEVHKDLQGERGDLNEQRNLLETERKEIAHQRRTQSMLVPVAQAVGGVLLAAVVIGFCWTLLFGLRRHDQSDAQLTELLVHDIVSERPIVLPAAAVRPALENVREEADDDARLLPGNSPDN